MWGNVGKENRKTLVEYALRGFRVPGAGIEPARIAPLVFETSASTDSAIRAFRIGEAVPHRVLVASGRTEGSCRRASPYAVRILKGRGRMSPTIVFPSC